MKLINVGAAVLNQTPLDWGGNRRRIVEVIHEARRQKVSVLCLPELCVTGYGCEDAFLSTYVHSIAAEVLSAVLPETTGMIVSLGLPVLYRNAMFNSACLVADGKIVGFVGKRFLAGDGLHYEPRWFKPWPQWACGELEICGGKYPLGDLYFDVGGVKIGFEICEDAWVANRPGAELARRGMDIILNPSASHFAFGKIDVRKRFVQEGSRAFGVSYVYANLLGNEAGRTIYDGGAIIATRGNVTALGERFSFGEWGLTNCVVDIDETRLGHARTHSYQPLIAHDEMVCVQAAFAYPEIEPEVAHPTVAGWEASPHRKEEEFARAMALGLFDYMRKSRSNGFVVSLSGGADSAAVACLVAYMVHRAIEDIGVDGLLERAPWIKANDDPAEPSQLQEAKFVAKLLTCVYQATRNSGEVTRGAAEGVANAIGATYWEFDVDALVNGYTEIVAKSLGRDLDWKTDDVALQNIQARVRSPGIWMVTNIKGALLLATSNRSEAAVGYATMDGDTSGGLSPIAGIDKAFLRQWL
ncbi:MAG TPA: nitrilase-related carbon-nitrogen hydrolase, partial [Pirellulales bacterium]